MTQAQAQWISTQSPIPAPGLDEWESVCRSKLTKVFAEQMQQNGEKGDQLEWTIYNTEKQKTGRKENGKEHTHNLGSWNHYRLKCVCLRLCFFSSAKLVVASECAHSGGLYTYSNLMTKEEEEEDGDSDGEEAITQTPFVCVQGKQSLLLLADTFTCQFCHLLFIIFPSLLLSSLYRHC